MEEIRTTRELGLVLRAARKAQGLTQEEFAGVANVGPRFLSEVERGKETAEVGLVLKVLSDAGLEVFIKRRGEP